MGFSKARISKATPASTNLSSLILSGLTHEVPSCRETQSCTTHLFPILPSTGGICANDQKWPWKWQKSTLLNQKRGEKTEKHKFWRHFYILKSKTIISGCGS